MSVNEEGRQTEIADELAEAAKTLAHSTRTVPRPSDSYELLGSLQAAQESLAQVYAQLAGWHGAAVDGTHYNGEDDHGTPGLPAVGADGQATGLLNLAAASAATTADLVAKAHAANAVVRWFDEVK
ncbi:MULTISPECIES: hypothetical protein [unclassified Cryobacterium]|uniref:hypothetical protein n=1 Tax=unclassified Cryobacterium TaxID=2649013 RepID=UPI000EF5F4F5|nr:MULTISPECIES: hypothetical protein [unclassified Cryobacterium]TFC57879.1 hypothetical protein E3O68_02370 [Cryobacterium sp. TMB3-1-2]TFC63268.1 hypothetical protein E3O60_00255 [Cryobacterium sp. TMB1-7]TFC75375.1 hypothetical protein E3T21_00095 [Cryobacterium sp. TMB3-15]TFC77873.1 hypothetical protein E3T22_04620 [Cryobacterium sp. TMB3-10]TFD46415.1 hypothetical protein E3T58_00865 [Cryobacterium sp. TMB3-12]